MHRRHQSLQPGQHLSQFAVDAVVCSPKNWELSECDGNFDSLVSVVCCAVHWLVHL